MCERSLPKNIGITALALVTVFGLPTPSSAQSAPKNADPLIASATPSSAQSAKAQSTDAKKKKKPASTPRPDRSAAAMAAPPATSGNEAARQAQNPLTPLYSIINENDTSPGVGPLLRTQNVLLIEPVIPIRLTPDFNLVTRWITPVVRQPALAPTSVRSSASATSSRSSSLRPHIRGTGLSGPWAPTSGFPPRPTRRWGSTSGVAGRPQWHCGSRVP